MKTKLFTLGTTLGAVLLTIALISPSCKPTASANKQTASTLETIKAAKTIVAGWAPYAPYSSMNLATKQPEGFYIDLFNQVAAEGEFKVVWVETTWGNMISDLKAGRFQAMAAPVFRTIPRAKEVGFTRHIDFFGLSAIVRKGEERFKDVSTFNKADISISVTQGEVGHDFCTRRLPKAKLNVHKTGDISLALVDVIQGKADAGICDSWTAKKFAREHKDTVTDIFAERPFNKVAAGWFVRPEDGELLQFLNTAIDWLESSGTLEEVASRYELGSFRR